MPRLVGLGWLVYHRWAGPLGMRWAVMWTQLVLSIRQTFWKAPGSWSSDTSMFSLTIAGNLEPETNYNSWKLINLDSQMVLRMFRTMFIHLDSRLVFILRPVRRHVKDYQVRWAMNRKMLSNGHSGKLTMSSMIIAIIWVFPLSSDMEKWASRLRLPNIQRSTLFATGEMRMWHRGHQVWLSRGELPLIFNLERTKATVSLRFNQTSLIIRRSPRSLDLVAGTIQTCFLLGRQTWPPKKCKLSSLSGPSLKLQWSWVLTSKHLEMSERKIPLPSCSIIPNLSALIRIHLETSARN